MLEISQPSLLIETGRTNGVFSVVFVVERRVTSECAALEGEKVLPITKNNTSRSEKQRSYS
jgi:hypothetical protein